MEVISSGQQDVTEYGLERERVITTNITLQCAEVSKDPVLLEGLCRELCAGDVASRITCHTFHLNKPTVFTLSNPEGKMVVKAVVDLAEREVPVSGMQTDPDDVSVSCDVAIITTLFIVVEICSQ